MSAQKLYRLTGAALVASFVTSLAGGVLHPIVDGNSHSAESMLAPLSPWAQHLVPADGSIVDSTPFLPLQSIGGLLFVASLIMIGIALFRSRVVSRRVGAFLVAGAVAVMIPSPEVPGLTGLLVELPRGLAVAVVGMQMIRAGRAS